jgi:hypothetical protein
MKATTSYQIHEVWSLYNEIDAITIFLWNVYTLYKISSSKELFPWVSLSFFLTLFIFLAKQIYNNRGHNIIDNMVLYNFAQ